LNFAYLRWLHVSPLTNSLYSDSCNCM